MEQIYEKESFDMVIFLDSISEDLKSKIVAIQPLNGVLKVHLNQLLSEALKAELDLAVISHDPSAPLTPAVQKLKDIERYTKRDQARGKIMAELAAENMERVRNGLWTVSELISLTQDAELKDLLDDIGTLSFEIAYSKVDALSNALLTQDIKDSWKLKLASNFY